MPKAIHHARGPLVMGDKRNRRASDGKKGIQWLAVYYSVGFYVHFDVKYLKAAEIYIRQSTSHLPHPCSTGKNCKVKQYQEIDGWKKYKVKKMPGKKYYQEKIPGVQGKSH